METVTYREWFLPLSMSDVTLQQALTELHKVGAGQQDIPLMVQLVENPAYKIPGIDLFHGAVDLALHDAIHLILGRGLLARDEAFVIGFTMGSTNKVSTAEETLFGFFAQHLYPQFYRFDEQALGVFRDAVRLGYVSSCDPLDQIELSALNDLTLNQIRQRLGIEEDLLRAYYRIETKKYGASPDSNRLLSDTAVFVNEP